MDPTMVPETVKVMCPFVLRLRIFACYSDNGYALLSGSVKFAGVSDVYMGEPGAAPSFKIDGKGRKIQGNRSVRAVWEQSKRIKLNILQHCLKLLFLFRLRGIFLRDRSGGGGRVLSKGLYLKC